MPLIPEVFGDRRARHRSLDTNKRGLIAGGNDHNGSLKPFLTEIAFDEISDLTSAFANQRYDTDISLGVSSDHRQQG